MTTCSKCKTEKPNEAFPPNPKKLNGLCSWCRKCMTESSKASKQKRAEYWRERDRVRAIEYYAKNRERFLERNRINARRWKKNNPEKFRSLQSARRSMKLANGVFVILERELRRLYKTPCIRCGSSEKITMDHIIPISKGGRHSVGNLQPLCLSCNASKGNRLMVEWRVSA